MTKISIDVQEIKKGIKDRALIAAGQLSELAKKAQTEIESKIPKEFSQKEVLKKVDQVVEKVKAQEFMKNPKVQEITRKIATLSEQIETSIAKNVVPFVNEARTRYNEFKASAGEQVTKAASDVKAKAEAATDEVASTVKSAGANTSSNVNGAAKKAAKKVSAKADV